MPKLVFTSGKASGQAHPLTRALVLGRQKGVDVLVDDIGASREHAKVFQQDGDWFVIDLNSRNGTKVNGSRITRWRLHHGDEIAIGTTVARFDAPELAAKAPPAAAAPPPPPAARPAPGAAPASPPPAARGPSAIERERERLRSADAEKRPPGARAAADDGSGVVIKETVLQYGRIDGRGGLMKDDLGQRGPLFKLVLYAGLALVFAGIVWGVVSALDEPPPDESQPEDVPGEVAPK